MVDSVSREVSHTKRPHPIDYPSGFVFISNESHAEAISNANNTVSSDTGCSEVPLVACVTETALAAASNVLTQA